MSGGTRRDGDGDCGGIRVDVGKAELNVRKHGVSFMDAVRAFLDPLAIDSRTSPAQNGRSSSA